jgi:RHS repeat-associated protein
MAATADERIPALTTSDEIFSLAVPFATFASEPRIGANAARGKKPHQGIFSKNRRLRVGAIWPKWPGTHQVSGQWWSETVLGIVIDANGNTLSDPSGKSYSWDFENRLTQAVNPGVGTTTFRYDPFGRRIQKSGPLGTTNYLYSGLSLVEELDGGGNILARYTQGRTIDEPLAELRSGTASYYEQDGVNSVSSLSTAAGALANTYSYDSFGKATSTGTLTNPFQYTGREFDSETGIYEYRLRYYDPTDGRFLQEDPIRFRGGANFYAYVKNSPIGAVDPLGLAKCIYSISAHTIVCQPNADPGSPAIDGPNGADAVQVGPNGVGSGNGTCSNNPSSACLKSVYQNGDPNSGGPIPPGNYALTYMYDSHWNDGHDRYDIAQLPFDFSHRAWRWATRERKAFELHRGTITHGCINVDINNPDAMSQYDDMQQLLLQEQFNGGNTMSVVP